MNVVEQVVSLPSLPFDVFVEQVSHKRPHALRVRRYIVAIRRQNAVRSARNCSPDVYRSSGFLASDLSTIFVEHRWHARRTQRRWIDVRIAHAINQLVSFATLLWEKLSPRQKLPQDDARRINVGSSVDDFAARLFRRHVRNLAVDDARRGFSSFSVELAKPKSVSLTSPLKLTSTLGGETSRWTSLMLPKLCA